MFNNIIKSLKFQLNMISFNKFSIKTVRKKIVVIKEYDITHKICLLVPSQNATIAPPIGSTLGQFGINIMEFCKQFNERTQDYDPLILLKVKIFILKNRNFEFDIQFSSSSFLLNEENYYLENEQISKFISVSSLFKICNMKSKLSINRNYFILKTLLGSYKGMKLRFCNDIVDFDELLDQ